MINPKDYILIWPKSDSNTRGVTYDMVKASHTDREYINFCKWMDGQTCGAMDDGKSAVYSHDYERWCRQGLKTAQNSEDWD